MIVRFINQYCTSAVKRYFLRLKDFMFCKLIDDGNLRITSVEKSYLSVSPRIFRVAIKSFNIKPLLVILRLHFSRLEFEKLK